VGKGKKGNGEPAGRDLTINEGEHIISGATRRIRRGRGSWLILQTKEGRKELSEKGRRTLGELDLKDQKGRWLMARSDGRGGGRRGDKKRTGLPVSRNA